jgi:hypothetical protein
MSSYGRSVVANIGTSVRVSADGHPEMKIGGITIDWTTVAGAAAPATLTDGVSILTGDLYLRYGQVLALITAGAVDVMTIGGGASGGTFTITMACEVNGVTTTVTTAAITYSAGLTAATVQAAILAALAAASPALGTGLTTVAGSNGGPYTITYEPALGLVTTTGSTASLTGGTPTNVVTVTTSGGNIGKYGPYDPNATDGRQTLTMGSAFIINRTVKFNDLYSDHPEVLFGGVVWLARILQSGVASASLAAGPTLANLQTTFPRLQLITENPAAG